MSIGTVNTEHINWLKVEAKYKILYHGKELDRQISQETTRKYNELIEFLYHKIKELERRINSLEMTK